MVIYVVVRAGGDGEEHNVFTDEKLARRWAKESDGIMYIDSIWTEELVEEMLDEIS